MCFSIASKYFDEKYKFEEQSNSFQIIVGISDTLLNTDIWENLWFRSKKNTCLVVKDSQCIYLLNNQENYFYLF